MTLFSMPSNKHNQAVAAIVELCRRYPKYTEVVGSIGRQSPLSIVIPKKGGALTREFYPDVFAFDNYKRVDIYEVWHTETENEAVLDVIYPLHHPNAYFLGIVCTGDGLEEKKAKGITDFFFRKFKELIPNDKRSYLLKNDWYDICQPEVTVFENPKTLKAFIKQKFEF